MIIEIPDDNSIIKWKKNDKEDWKFAEISDLIKSYEERPIGDCISRSALKKALQNREECKECTDIDCIHCFYDIIDNASTVEPKLKDDIIEAFNLITDQEFEHSDSFWIETPKGKKIEFEKKRPQGEWIRKVDEVGFISHICSECGAEIEVEDPRDDKFCFNCGAKMKGGKE